MNFESEEREGEEGCLLVSNVVWEMNKSRDVRRLLSGCSGHNHINSNKNKLVVSELSGGGAIFTAKSKREKLRRLSLVGRGGGGGCDDDQDTAMGSGGSDGEDELTSSTTSAKKLKLHKKILEDPNTVDHASIPRKLRSVIKKRSCHSISLPLPSPEMVNHGLQTTRKDCLKKSKCGTLISDSLTKDEEEVAEALYALARTVTCKVTPLLNKSDGESPDGNQMDSEKLEDSMLSAQGPPVPEEVAELSSNLTSEELSKQNTKVNDLGKPAFLSQPNLSETIPTNLNTSSSASQVIQQSLAQISSGTKLNNFEQTEVLLSQRISGSTGDLANQDMENHALIKGKENGSKLLPSIYSQVSHGSGGDDGFPSRYAATKVPYWLHTAASSSEPGLHQSHVSHKNVSEFETHNGKIKSRCATHVHISHFIQLSQTSEEKETPLLEPHRFKPSEGVTLGVLRASSSLIPVSNGSTTMVPGSHICSSVSEKNLLDASNYALITPRSPSHVQERASLAPGSSTLRKQCFDFLSLSTGGSGTALPLPLIRDDSVGSLPLPPNLIPSNLYRGQLSASTPVASLPHPPNLIQSNAYQNQLSTSAPPKPPAPQVHLQLPPYFTRSIQLDSRATSIKKQPQLQPQPPQQHPIWMAQLAGQSGPGSLAPSQIAHWQNSRQEPQMVQYKQAQILPSQSSLSLGAHLPKYLQMPQQHHQMLHTSPPFPPIKTNSQHSPVPIGCDKSGS